MNAEIESEARQRGVERVEARSDVDSLTGLYNRAAWDRLLEIEEKRCRRYGNPAGVLLVDVDGLEQVSAANLAIAAPSTAGGIGPFEYFAREVAVVYGATVTAATAYALVLHAVLLGPVVLLALILVWRRHLATYHGHGAAWLYRGYAFLGRIVGIVDSNSFFFFLSIMGLLLFCLQFSLAISTAYYQRKQLIQKMALLEARVRELENVGS